MTLHISKDGVVDAAKVKVKIYSTIERAKMEAVNGIVVHQTNAPTASATFNSYSNTSANNVPNGAHFLIDKDGTIYQTASLYRATNHVGYLQSRCVMTQKCTPTELKEATVLEKTKGARNKSIAVHRGEMAKAWPQRYPSNADSIGIEIVGASTGLPGKEIYEPVNPAQNASLRWLVKELAETLGVSMQEIYRHPEIGRKNTTEASTARW